MPLTQSLHKSDTNHTPPSQSLTIILSAISLSLSKNENLPPLSRNENRSPSISLLNFHRRLSLSNFSTPSAVTLKRTHGAAQCSVGWDGGGGRGGLWPPDARRWGVVSTGDVCWWVFYGYLVVGVGGRLGRVGVCGCKAVGFDGGGLDWCFLMVCVYVGGCLVLLLAVVWHVFVGGVLWRRIYTDPPPGGVFLAVVLRGQRWRCFGVVCGDAGMLLQVKNSA